MPNNPTDFFTDAQWHIEASNDTGADHALHPRQYVITCEWCEGVFWGANKGIAMQKLQRHRDEIYKRYLEDEASAFRKGAA